MAPSESSDPYSPEADSLVHQAQLAIVGSEEALKRLRESYEVNRKLPIFTRLKLGLRASRIILKMLAGYLINSGQPKTK